MHADKAPGPNLGFFKRFWDLLGPEIFHASVQWLEKGSFPNQLNNTNIVLIPKSIKELRPISLCNVIYKIISKTQGKIGIVALKIDISKAFDRVNWTYLYALMTHMGFHSKWIHWMWMCLESMKFQVIVNGDSVCPTTLARGLRQGDPLSPYLFILCTEGISSLLRNAEAQGDIHGVKICKGAPQITHLLFGDDCFLFCRASDKECHTLKAILQQYESTSGQAINMQKSEIYYSRNTKLDVRHYINFILGVNECMGIGKYVGIPSMIGRNKKAIFSYLKDRIWKKIQHWTGKHLSKTGRETLIKSVA
uniref:LINE-1 reverse transcriptase isogeny n=1 Tax=Cajanus cajan TaxID=3821 RepID=A0A151QST2_CAJCA|nr:LINE-1 reverse transcriptase isogeny [Cajanus cajan]